MTEHLTPRRAYPDEMPETVVTAGPGEPAEPTSALFEGDGGELPEDVRRVLVLLLQGPFVSRDSHPRPWATLLSHEKTVRARLGDLFLELVLDRDRGLGFIRKVTPPEIDVPGVVRSNRLTLIDTALVLHLRDLLLRAESDDLRVIVGRDELSEVLAVYQPLTGTNKAGYEKRIHASVEKLKNSSVLRSTREPDRYEVSPILGLVFGADEVIAVTRELRRFAAAASAGAGASPTDVSDAPAEVG